jgi:hypothetical protein
MKNDERSESETPQRPEQPEPAGPKQVDRRELVRRLALTHFAVLASPLLRKASASAAQSGCGTYSNGLLVPDSGCTPNSRDTDCGQQIIQGGSSTVSSDEDCGFGANGANPDNCCGGISWAPQGGTVGYFNDVTCGYTAGRDQDCGLPNPQGVRMRDNDCGSWTVSALPPFLLPPMDNYNDYEPVDPQPQG